MVPIELVDAKTYVIEGMAEIKLFSRVEQEIERFNLINRGKPKHNGWWTSKRLIKENIKDSMHFEIVSATEMTN